MEIRTLENTPLEDIVNCFSIAFADYIVKMPDSVDYWRERYFRSRVDYALSFGVFDKGKMVALIMNGVGMHLGKLTAFNTGTGVFPTYRGRQLVDKMYDFAQVGFKKKGIEKCLLEVIDENARAIRVYERNGFEILRRLKCYKGSIEHCKEAVFNERIAFKDLEKQGYACHEWYSWDHNNASMHNAGDFYQCYLVNTPSHDTIGYFICTEEGYVPQLECKPEDLKYLLSGVAKISKEIKLNNLDASRTGMVEAMKAHGIENVIDQFEMHWIM